MKKFRLKRFEPLEKDIQESVCQYLAAKKYFFWRQNNFSIYDADRGSFRVRAKWSRNGVPDVLLVKKGILWGLEIKRPTGKQSEYQVEFQKDLENAGGKYLIIRSIEDLINNGL